MCIVTKLRSCVVVTLNTHANFGACVQGAVYMYYGLTNYYQNHRRYVASRDDDQLHGLTESTANSLSSNCDPYRGNYNLSSSGIPYAPCGSIANSLFNGE